MMPMVAVHDIDPIVAMWILRGLFAAGTALSLAFVWLYLRWMPALRSRGGRHIVAFTASLAILMGLTVLNSFVRWAGQYAVSILAVSIVVALLAQRLALLIFAKRASTDLHRRLDESPPFDGPRE